MSQRGHHLTYCSICKKREFDLQKGIICSLTNEIANFNSVCNDFEQDENELNRIHKSLRNQIESRYSLVLLAPTNETEGYYQDFKPEKYESLPRKKVGKQKAPAYGFLAIGMIISIYFLSTAQIQNKLHLIGLILLPLFFITVGIIILLNQKTYFTWNDDFMIISGKKVFYNDILTIGSVGQYRPAKHSIVLGTKTQGLIEFNTFEYNVNVSKIAALIDKKRNTLHNNG